MAAPLLFNWKFILKRGSSGMHYSIYQNSTYKYIIAGKDYGIDLIKVFSDDLLNQIKAKGYSGDNLFFEEAIKQLEEYFGGKRKKFDLKINLNGSDFQKKVWTALCDIPYGETRSYKDIAKYIGDEKASRAVGMANNKNPIQIIIPCHRVIGSDGSLRGYAGGIEIKKRLLEIEEHKPNVYNNDYLI